jgi:WhiB family redox-sensing transcriptional regulator
VSDWRDLALCRQVDPELFFPEKGGGLARPGKRICGACEVRVECLEYALASRERFGIYGGLSENERRKLLRDTVAA